MTSHIQYRGGARHLIEPHQFGLACYRFVAQSAGIYVTVGGQNQALARAGGEFKAGTLNP